MLTVAPRHQFSASFFIILFTFSRWVCMILGLKSPHRKFWDSITSRFTNIRIRCLPLLLCSSSQTLDILKAYFLFYLVLVFKYSSDLVYCTNLLVYSYLNRVTLKFGIILGLGQCHSIEQFRLPWEDSCWEYKHKTLNFLLGTLDFKPGEYIYREREISYIFK